MNNIIVGTAGHIDHGKTALIKALTGFDGDSTDEEIKRKITINLSFSNLKNENSNIAFIDVPGHEKLVKNMIAGAFGFEVALLVVDAKEGIKPQTIEHLQILNFFEVSNLIVVLSKKDLVNKEILEKRKQELQESLKEFSNLKIFSINEVSIKDEVSLEKLKNTLFSIPIKPKQEKIPRFYIDRAFNIKGQGSVVTGTLLDGIIKKDEKLFIADIEKMTKVKNIQVHENSKEIAFMYERVALNLDMDLKELKQGMLITKKGYFRGFKTIEVYIKQWGNKSIKHNQQITIHIGSKQVSAKILFLDEKFATLELKERIFSIFGEKIIISNSGFVVGGGIVLNPIIEPMKKKDKIIFLEKLMQKDFKSAFSILTKHHKYGFGLISSYQRFALMHNEALKVLANENEFFLDDKNLVIYPKATLEKLRENIINIFKINSFALISAKSLSLKFKWASEVLFENILHRLKNQNQIEFKDGIYFKKGQSLEDLKTKSEDRLFDSIAAGDFTPQAPYNIYDELDMDRKTGDDCLKKLTKSKKVVRLAHNLFIEANNLSKVLNKIRQIIKEQGYADVGNVKESLNLSRKFAICYLEYLDKFDDIMKEDTKRKLK